MRRMPPKKYGCPVRSMKIQVLGRVLRDVLWPKPAQTTQLCRINGGIIFHYVCHKYYEDIRASRG